MFFVYIINFVLIDRIKAFVQESTANGFGIMFSLSSFNHTVLEEIPFAYLDFYVPIKNLCAKQRRILSRATNIQILKLMEAATRKQKCTFSFVRSQLKSRIKKKKKKRKAQRKDNKRFNDAEVGEGEKAGKLCRDLDLRFSACTARSRLPGSEKLT